LYIAEIDPEFHTTQGMDNRVLSRWHVIPPAEREDQGYRINYAYRENEEDKTRQALRPYDITENGIAVHSSDMVFHDTGKSFDFGKE